MKRIHINDIILNVAVILVCIAVPIVVSMTSKGQKTAVISWDGNAQTRISLSENGTFYTHGVEVTVKDGKAFVSKSSCPDGLCMKMKKAENAGDSIICVPNKVSIRIAGVSDERGADVVAG